MVFDGPGKQKANNSNIVYQVGEGNMAAVPSQTDTPVQVCQGNEATDNREAGADGGMNNKPAFPAAKAITEGTFTNVPYKAPDLPNMKQPRPT